MFSDGEDERPGGSMWTPLKVTRDTSSEEENEATPAPSRKRKPSSSQLMGHGAKRPRTSDPQRIRSLTLDSRLPASASQARVTSASGSVNASSIASTSRSVLPATTRSDGASNVSRPVPRQRRQTEPGPITATPLNVPIKQEDRTPLRRSSINTADDPIVISDSEEEIEKQVVRAVNKAPTRPKGPPPKPSSEIIDLCSDSDDPPPPKVPVGVTQKPKLPLSLASSHRPSDTFSLSSSKAAPVLPSSQVTASTRGTLQSSSSSTLPPSSSSVSAASTLGPTSATSAKTTVGPTVTATTVPSAAPQSQPPVASNAAPGPGVPSNTIGNPSAVPSNAPKPQAGVSRAAARAAVLPIHQHPHLPQAPEATFVAKAFDRRAEDLRHAKVVSGLKPQPPSHFKDFLKSSASSAPRPATTAAGGKRVADPSTSTAQVNPSAAAKEAASTASSNVMSKSGLISPQHPDATNPAGKGTTQAHSSSSAQSSAQNERERSLPGRPPLARTSITQGLAAVTLSSNSDKKAQNPRRKLSSPTTSDDDLGEDTHATRYFGCGESSCMKKGRAFSSITRLNQHHTERHNALPLEPYLCAADGCGKTFKYERDLVGHIQEAHMPPSPPLIAPQPTLPTASALPLQTANGTSKVKLPSAKSGTSSAASTGKESASPKEAPPSSASSDDENADDDPPIQPLGRRKRVGPSKPNRPAAIARPATVSGAITQKRPTSGQANNSSVPIGPPQRRPATANPDPMSSCSPSRAGSEDSAAGDRPLPARKQHHRRVTDKGMSKTRADLERLARYLQDASQETRTPSPPLPALPPSSPTHLEHEVFHAEEEANRPNGMLVKKGLDVDWKTAEDMWPAEKIPSPLHKEIERISSSFQRQNLQLVFQATISANTAADEPFAPPIDIINNLSDDPFREMCPPFEFYYTNRMIRAKGVPPPSEAEGCDCIGPCRPNSETCRCAILQKKTTAEFGCAYDEKGSLIINPVLPVFECHPGCQCGDACPNKVVQNGRKYKIQIKKTRNKGWGVFSPDPMPKGTYIGTYSGELIPDREATIRAEFYDDFGRTYLFNIDSYHLRLPKNVVFYAIDAFHVGNFTRFLNHSCEPNCKITPVYTTDRDFHKPLLCLFTCRDIRAGEELCFSYAGDESDDEVAPISPKKGRGRSKKQQEPPTEREGKSFARCQCGASRCRGSMWRKVDNDEESEGAPDESMEQDDI